MDAIDWTKAPRRLEMVGGIVLDLDSRTLLVPPSDSMRLAPQEAMVLWRICASQHFFGQQEGISPDELFANWDGAPSVGARAVAVHRAGLKLKRVGAEITDLRSRGSEVEGYRVVWLKSGVLDVGTTSPISSPASAANDRDQASRSPTCISRHQGTLPEDAGDSVGPTSSQDAQRDAPPTRAGGLPLRGSAKPPELEANRSPALEPPSETAASGPSTKAPPADEVEAPSEHDADAPGGNPRSPREAESSGAGSDAPRRPPPHSPSADETDPPNEQGPPRPSAARERVRRVLALMLIAVWVVLLIGLFRAMNAPVPGHIGHAMRWLGMPLPREALHGAMTHHLTRPTALGIWVIDSSNEAQLLRNALVHELIGNGFLISACIPAERGVEEIRELTTNQQLDMFEEEWSNHEIEAKWRDLEKSGLSWADIKERYPELQASHRVYESIFPTSSCMLPNQDYFSVELSVSRTSRDADIHSVSVVMRNRVSGVYLRGFATNGGSDSASALIRTAVADAVDARK